MKISTIILLASLTMSSFAAETKPVKKDGIQLRLASSQNAIVPGKTITIGLFIEHEPTYHTYWKSPGIVGVPTQLKWKMPDGFKAGELQFPAPQRTKMATLIAYGYETDTCLLTKIHVPESVSGDSVTFKVRAGWMCCASGCHPGWHDFEFTLPVSRTKSEPERDEKWATIFEKNQARFPKKPPEKWLFTAKKTAPERDAPLEVSFTLPDSNKLPDDFNLNDLYFFCHDNQVNSDKPQIVKIDPNHPRTVSIRLPGTDFGPEAPQSLSGVLFHPKGWPGLDSKWIEVSTPWQTNE